MKFAAFCLVFGVATGWTLAALTDEPNPWARLLGCCLYLVIVYGAARATGFDPFTIEETTHGNPRP